MIPTSAWLVFGAVVAVSLAADLLGHRSGRSQSRGSAIAWSVVWITVALLFGAWVWRALGRDAGEDFLTAWLIEKSLSVDNLFVFLVLFDRLRIPKSDQHRVLFWGILGALVTRAAFIAAGSAMLAAWHGAIFVLGAFLVYTGLKTLREQSKDGEHDEGKLLRFVRRRLRVSSQPAASLGGRFLVVEEGRRVATPLLLALVVIELTDVLFAIDSIPAVFSITSEPFIVYSSNVFAVLGMRALYLVLADLLAGLHYLRYALSGILVLAGLKMLVSPFYAVPHAISLLAIGALLTAAIVPSVVRRRREARRVRPPDPRDLPRAPDVTSVALPPGRGERAEGSA